MGEALDRVTALDAGFHFGTYARKPVLFTEGRGMHLTDDEGRDHLDFVAGIGSVNLGHAHPDVTAAVCGQMSRLTQVSNLYHVEWRAELAERLATLVAISAAATRAVAADGPAPGPDPGAWRTFLCNSGAEANEGAIKIARKWGRESRGDECTGIVTALGSFHGRTLATLAATGQPGKKEAFAPLPEGFSHVPLNDIAALERAVGPDTCAVLLEPIQGEGGVWPCTAEYLADVRRLCDERGALLILDEVQTGCWRTGGFLAAEHFGVVPDVVTLAKSLANGLPAGAIVAKAEVAAVLKPGDHGTTFGGGPVICAAALATLGALDREGLGANAVEAGAYLRARLGELAGAGGPVAQVRGVGLMNAVSLREPVAADAVAALLERGIVANGIGADIVRMLPPLVCGHEEIDTLTDTLHEVLDASGKG